MSRPAGCAAVLAMSVALSVAACSVGPRYETPQVSTPGSFQGVPAQHSDAALPGPLSVPLATAADLSRWWTQFHDATLDGLVQRALAANLSLQAAALRVRQAREQEIIAGASYYPSVGLNGSAVRLHANSSPLGSGGSGQSGGPPDGNPPVALNVYTLGFDAIWEADLFGGTRHGVEAARANTAEASWELADGQVSLTAEVATGYLSLRAAQARLAILRDSIGRQEQLLVMVEARARTGFVTQLDVNQQRAQLAGTRAALPPLQAQAAAQIHALSVLLAQEPGALAQELTQEAPLPTVPTTLPVGLPADLLRRRPDVRQAERHLAAATAEIGVAVANLFPRLNLVALPVMVSPTAGQIFNGSSFSYVGAGMISWPVFEGSKLRANVRATKEQRDEAYLAYQQAVLVALQDVEDALTRYSTEQRRLLALQESQAAAASSLHIAEEQYRAGIVPFINVLTASATLLSTQDQVAQSQQALAQNLVSLYKALGGGWTADGAGSSVRTAESARGTP